MTLEDLKCYADFSQECRYKGWIDLQGHSRPAMPTVGTDVAEKVCQQVTVTEFVVKGLVKRYG